MNEPHEPLTPEAEKQLTCAHKDFTANVAIERLEDSGRFLAGVTVNCAECGLSFSFNGLPFGLNLNGACASPDGLEARLSISPGVGGLFVPKEGKSQGLQGFSIQ